MISKNNKIINTLMGKSVYAKDLENYNRAHMLFQVLCGFEPIFYITHPNEEPKKVKNAIQNRLRNGGGKHEWLAVSKAPVWKDWCSVYDVLNGTTNTKSINFLNIKKADGTIASGPHGCTSKGVSDAAHKELFNIIESSKDFEDYKAKLNKWADNHLELVDSDGNVIKKGAEALPSNLRKKPARIAPCGKKYY